MSNNPNTEANNPLQGINLLIPPLYRIGLIIVSGIWAWGFNLYYLSILRIDAHSLIKHSIRTGHDQPCYQGTFRLASTATTISGLSVALFWLVTRGDPDAVLKWDIIPQSYIFFLFLLFILPVKRFSQAGRYHFLSTLRRVSVGGLAEAQDGKFGDILLADVLTSYAKVLGDSTVMICMLLSGQASLNSLPDRACGSGFFVSVIVGLPSLIRLRQCLIEYHRARRRPNQALGWGGQHLANALKYSTALPALAFRALQQRRRGGSEHAQISLNRLWIGTLALNSSYSFYWDVAKDWNLSLFSKERSRLGHPWALRPRLYFRPYTVYYFAVGVDFLLRFTWVLTVLPYRGGVSMTDGGIFTLELLEVFRRWMWMFFRIETEWIRTHTSIDNVLLLSEIEE